MRLRRLLLLLLVSITGCAGFSPHRADWCVSRGKLTVTLPLDPYPYQHHCTARDIYNRIFH